MSEQKVLKMNHTSDERSGIEEVQTEENLSEILKVRREKLVRLQSEGNNPYEITSFDITHSSQQIFDYFDEMEGQEVILAGRIMSRSWEKPALPIYRMKKDRYRYMYR